MPRRNTAESVFARTTKDTETGCWLWTGAQCGSGATNRHGYGQTWFNGRLCKTHRLAYELTHGAISRGLHVLHRCDNPPCINPEHLYLGTHQQNMRDRDARHRRTPARGERHGRAKLTEQDVTEIRRLLQSGHTQTSIAPKFGVSQRTISFIERGEHWNIKI